MIERGSALGSSAGLIFHHQAPGTSFRAAWSAPRRSTGSNRIASSSAYRQACSGCHAGAPRRLRPIATAGRDRAPSPRSNLHLHSRAPLRTHVRSFRSRSWTRRSPSFHSGRPGERHDRHGSRLEGCGLGDSGRLTPMHARSCAARHGVVSAGRSLGGARNTKGGPAGECASFGSRPVSSREACGVGRHTSGSGSISAGARSQ